LRRAQSVRNGGVVARLKSPLLRKLEKVLSRRFPAPATIRLEDHDGIIGVVTSAKFARMDSIHRQNLLGDLVEACLNPEERRRVQIIVGVTPEEGTGYLAGAD
jgi:hypothetical protein